MIKFPLRGFGILFLYASVSLLVINAYALSATGQADVRVTADVDTTTVSTEEMITLTVTIEGVIEQLDDPRLPELDGMRVSTSTRSSQFNLVDGTVTSRTIFSYRLQPVKRGVLTIPSIPVSVNGATYGTEPIVISVVDVTSGDPGTPSVEGSNPDSPAQSDTNAPEETCASAPYPFVADDLRDQDFFVTADIGNRAPFVGESLIYCFSLYQAANLSRPPQLEWPDFNGFLVEDPEPTAYFERTVGERHFRVTEVRKALFPTLAGPTTIEPTTLGVTVDDRDMVLKTDSLTVDVQPLPAGAPDGFTGAVGQFEIDAWVEPEKAQTGQSVTLFLRVTGAGNLATVSDPTSELEDNLADWRVLDSLAITNLNAGTQGEKIFERLLLPRTAGDLVIPKMTLTYFDPNLSEYRQAHSQPLAAHVTPRSGDAASGPLSEPGGQAVLNPGKETGASETALARLRRMPDSLMSHPAFWLASLVAPITVIAGWLWLQYRRPSETDASTGRENGAPQRALEELARAQDQHVGDEQARFASVARALTLFLGEQLNEPPRGLTRDVICDGLATLNVPQNLIDRTLSCLDAADAGRFAPVATNREFRALAAESRAVILDLDATIRNP